MGSSNQFGKNSEHGTENPHHPLPCGMKEGDRQMEHLIPDRFLRKEACSFNTFARFESVTASTDLSS